MKSKILFTLTSFFWAFGSFSQTEIRNGEVLGNISIGGNEVTAVLDTESGCIYKSSLHNKGLFVAGEKVHIEYNYDTNSEKLKKIDQILHEEILLTNKKCGESNPLDNFEQKSGKVTSPYKFCKKDQNPIGGGKGYNKILRINNQLLAIQEKRK